jgi:hypothetical protein
MAKRLYMHASVFITPDKFCQCKIRIVRIVTIKMEAAWQSWLMPLPAIREDCSSNPGAEKKVYCIYSCFIYKISVLNRIWQLTLSCIFKEWFSQPIYLFSSLREKCRHNGQLFWPRVSTFLSLSQCVNCIVVLFWEITSLGQNLNKQISNTFKLVGVYWRGRVIAFLLHVLLTAAN